MTCLESSQTCCYRVNISSMDQSNLDSHQTHSTCLLFGTFQPTYELHADNYYYKCEIMYCGSPSTYNL